MAMQDINDGKMDADFASDAGIYCSAMLIAIERIKSGGKKSKTESSSKKAEARSDRAKKAHQFHIEELMGKKPEKAEVVDDEAEEALSTFGEILKPTYMEDMKEDEFRSWSHLLQRLIPSSVTSSNLLGGRHSLVVIYDTSHAQAFRTTDVDKSGFVITLSLNVDSADQLRQHLLAKDMDRISLVYLLFVDFLHLFYVLSSTKSRTVVHSI